MYAEPPNAEPKTDPIALEVQQVPWTEPFTFSFFAKSTVTQSAHTSAKHIHADIDVIVSTRDSFESINFGTII